MESHGCRTGEYCSIIIFSIKYRSQAVAGAGAAVSLFERETRG